MVESKPAMLKPTTFYIIRHGETPYNAQKLIQGHIDIELNDNGIQQAKKLSKKLKDVKFDNVFASDLKRAHKTAQLIAEERNILEVKTDELLREMYLGSYEGRKIADFQQELKDLLEARDNLPKEERFKHQVLDIETDQSIINRFLTFFNKTADLTKEKNNLIVTHGAAMRTFLIYLEWAEYAELPHGSIDNTAYIKLEKNNDTFVIQETFGIQKIEK
ncbi:MAG: histidine phosphatase family protein [Patescibacteria group bacterium]